MTLKEKTRPSQQQPGRPSGTTQWLMVAALVAAVTLLAIRVVDLMGDNQATVEPRAGIASEAGWTLEDELEAIRSHLGADITAGTSFSEWTLEQELAAIRGHGANSPAQPSEADEPLSRQFGFR